MDEQDLSQKMSHLLADTFNEKESMIKDIKAEIERVPNYLTKRNNSFKQIIHQVLSTITTAITDNNIEELRKIAILIYKIMVIQSYRLLWAAYLKSGMGQLIIQSQEQLSYPVTLSIWPKEIKTFLKSTNMTETSENEMFMNFVNYHLNVLDKQLKQNQIELNIKANHFDGYTLTIQKRFETYIEKNLQSVRMEIEHKVELVYYDYHIEALKLAYYRCSPNEYQKQLMKQLCCSKYQQEITEQEVNLLQQQIIYYNSPSQSFESSPISHCPLIDSIQNPIIRQQVFKQYKEIAIQSRAKMFTLYMKSAVDRSNEHKNKFDTDVKKMWSDRSSHPDNEKIAPIMIQFIEQRYNKISERIKCIYKYKAQSIGPNLNL